jgi:hypothetical protein
MAATLPRAGFDHYFLAPEDNVRLALTRLEDWLSRSVAGKSDPATERRSP